MRQPAVRLERVGGAREPDRRLAAEADFHELGPGEVPREVLERAVDGEPRRDGVREVGVLEQKSHLRGVITQRQVVVGQVAHDAPGRLAKRFVAVELSVPFSFAKSKAQALVAI